MNEYIFYSLEGETCAPNNKESENCQMLGCAFGEDEHEALNHLFEENGWIKEQGFDRGKIIGRELSPCNNAESKLSYLVELLDEKQMEEYMEWLKQTGND